MMKKLISAFLCVALIMTFVPQIIFASSASSDASVQSKVLFDLGVTDFEDASDAFVTRSAFTRYAMKLADIPVTPHVGTVFDDVSETHPDYNYIMSAVDFGLISRATSYRPSDYVTFNEASKIMIKLLGYDYMAEAKGGYPHGYLQTARSIGLFDGVSNADGSLSQANAAIILCNALHIRLPEITYTAEGASEYRTGTATILGKYRNMSFVNGTVDGNAVYATKNEAGLGEGKMSIDGVVYNSGKINTVNLFGCNVDAYINNETKTVVSCQVTDFTKIFSIYAEDVISYEKRKFTYEDVNGKEKSVSIASDAYVFFNGKVFDFDSEKLIPKSGSLTFISNGSGAATTLYIKSYKTTVVERISKSDYIVVDKFSKDNNITLDPDKIEYTIVSQDGEILDFDSIMTGDVLCSAISDDGKIAEIVCVRDKFMGTYSGFSGDYIQVDGTSYRLGEALVGKVSEIVTLGKDATFRLDIDQRIADIVPVGGEGEMVGYLFVGRCIEKGMSKDLYAQILTLDGTKSAYKFADTFSINDIGYKDVEKAYAAHKSPDYNSLICGMVKFRLDADGNIKSLNYSDKEGGTGGLYVTQTVEKADEYHTYQRWFNSIGNDIICDTSLVVFKVPNPLYSVDNIDEEHYTVEPPTVISDNWAADGYKLVGYTTKPNDGLSQYLLMQKIEDDFATGEVTISGSPYMVNSVKKVILNEEPCEAMELCNNTYGVSAPLVVYSKGEDDFTLAGVESGDIVRININEKRVVKGFKIIYKYGKTLFEDGKDYISTSNARVPSMAIRIAKAYRFRTDVMDVVPTSVKLETAVEKDFIPLYMASSAVQKYDAKLGRVVNASVGDIKDYESFGDDSALIIYYRSTYGHPSVFLIDVKEK